MNDELRDYFESKLPELVSAARYRIRNRLRDVGKALVLRGFEPLTIDQARQWQDDIVSESVCNHWCAYCSECDRLDGARARAWLDQSSLDVSRRMVYRLCHGIPCDNPDYYLTPEAREILGELPARYLELRASGVSDSAICKALFKSDNSRCWSLLHHTRRQAEYRLEVAALVASVVDRLRNENLELRTDLSELRTASC